MTVKAFAKKFGISEDEMWDALKDAGYLKNDYSPKTKYINDELFDEDSNIVDSKTLLSKMTEYFGSDEDESDEDEEEDEEDFDEDESEEDEEETEVTVDSVKESIENLSASKEELAELIGLLTDKLVNFSDEEDEEELEDEDYDDEDYEDEEEGEETPKSKKSSNKTSAKDPNAEGNYRGWTITKKGITITATKGKKKLTTSVKGNIRQKIDDVED